MFYICQLCPESLEVSMSCMLSSASIPVISWRFLKKCLGSGDAYYIQGHISGKTCLSSGVHYCIQGCVGSTFRVFWNSINNAGSTVIIMVEMISHFSAFTLLV